MTTEIGPNWNNEDIHGVLSEAKEIGEGVQYYYDVGNEWRDKTECDYSRFTKYRAKPKPKITYYHVFDDNPDGNDVGDEYVTKSSKGYPEAPPSHSYIGTIEVEE